MSIEFWIMTSNEDKASRNIYKYLHTNFKFELSPVTDKWHIWQNNKTYLLNIEDYLPKSILDKKLLINIRLVNTEKKLIFIEKELGKEEFKKQIGANFTIYASRHKSKSGIPALLTHTSGNWTSNNSHGGFPNSICTSSGILIKNAYLALNKFNSELNLNWPVDLEVNHHGPTEMPCPTIFMELGSKDQDYENINGIEAVSKSIIYTISEFLRLILIDYNLIDEITTKITNATLYESFHKNLKNSSKLFCLGFGGPHYAKNFSKNLISNPEVFISHILPKYFAENFTTDMCDQIIKRTLEPINTFLVDWRGLNSNERNHVLKILENFNIQILKTKDLK